MSQHPLYSPNLILRDFSMFQKLKPHFELLNEVLNNVMTVLKGLLMTFSIIFRHGRDVVMENSSTLEVTTLTKG